MCIYIYIYLQFVIIYTLARQKKHPTGISQQTDVRSSAATATPEAPPVPPVTGPVVTAVLLEDGCSSNGKHGKGRNHA